MLGAPLCMGCGAPGPLACARCCAAMPPATETAAVPHVQRVLGRWDYQGLARRLVLELKLRGLTGAAEPLIGGLVDLALRQGLRAGCVTWVPGRSVDQRRRGFDHAHRLALGVARALGLPCVALLGRSRPNRDQAGLSREERRANLVDAFDARPWAGPVALVDDLVTTGATAAACARAMRAAGVTGVEVLAPCRA